MADGTPWKHDLSHDSTISLWVPGAVMNMAGLPKILTQKLHHFIKGRNPLNVKYTSCRKCVTPWMTSFTCHLLGKNEILQAFFIPPTLMLGSF